MVIRPYGAICISDSRVAQTLLSVIPVLFAPVAGGNACPTYFLSVFIGVYQWLPTLLRQGDGV